MKITTNYGKIKPTINTKKLKKNYLPENKYLNHYQFRQSGQSSINFGAMKKHQFSDIDLIIVNKFKAPIEKFKTHKDFQEYCQHILDEKYLNNQSIKEFTTNSDLVAQNQKKIIIENWKKYLTKKENNFTPSTVLYILSSIFTLKDDEMPLSVNKQKVLDTLEEIKAKSKKEKNVTWNFYKLYKNNLQKIYLEDINTQLDENLTGWIIIPGKKNNSENFEHNVEKLQALSKHNWCTKKFKAAPYLLEGDFHIYIEQGKSIIGIRFKDSIIQEIQGEKNNYIIPIKYLDTVKKYISKNGYQINNESKSEIKRTEEIKEQIEKIKLDLDKKLFENKEYDKILPYFGIEIINKDKNGLMSISELRNPTKDISFEDIGIDINDLVNQIKEVSGDLKLHLCLNLKSTGNIESVGGNATLSQCGKLKSTNIKDVGGNFNIWNCENIPNLSIENIKNNLNIRGCKNLTNLNVGNILGNLTIIRCDKLKEFQAGFINGSIKIEKCPHLVSKPYNYLA